MDYRGYKDAFGEVITGKQYKDSFLIYVLNGFLTRKNDVDKYLINLFKEAYGKES